jgi:hypothetical protein
MNHTATLDGKPIAWHDTTEFLVQVGKGRGSYRTRYSFTGNLKQALIHYRCINIGNGYKKRLVAPSMNKPLLARAFS